MNFEITALFAYADDIARGALFLVAFFGGYIVGGICQRG